MAVGEGVAVFRAFRQRRPWAASLLALFDPFTAMLCLGQVSAAPIRLFAVKHAYIVARGCDGQCVEDSPCDGKAFEATLPGGRQHRVIYLNEDLPQDNTRVFIVPSRSYFVVRDNRDNSNDSRLEVGFVPENSVLGRAAFKIWNENSGRLTLDAIR